MATRRLPQPRDAAAAGRSDNHQRLEEYLKAQGIVDVDVSSFMRLKRYAAQRAEAVKSLGLKP